MFSTTANNVVKVGWGHYQSGDRYRLISKRRWSGVGDGSVLFRSPLWVLFTGDMPAGLDPSWHQFTGGDSSNGSNKKTTLLGSGCGGLACIYISSRWVRFIEMTGIIYAQLLSTPEEGTPLERRSIFRCMAFFSTRYYRKCTLKFFVYYRMVKNAILSNKKRNNAKQVLQLYMSEPLGRSFPALLTAI